MSARLVAWVALLAITTAVILVAYVVISSSLGFFESEVSKLAPKLDSAPQLRSVVEDAVRFCSSFVWITFLLLLLALGVCLVVLWLEDLACR